ncbi:hypothetical protein [Chryseosolibacter indicus]|uniref:Bacteriocin n=1 Tax=Chryseosolibacter indicus TaxID=2782351 RepID=A0ABS5VXF2_9BACT|nr:hypothetical protein [Chryseosolibacter indicus]MBT1705424.1 hypothetical protein [Chryseosolibacter indicus]
MINFQTLGRSLSKDEQKSIFGGDDQEGVVCTCIGGPGGPVSSICVGPADRCVAAAVRDCDGTRVICGDGGEHPVDDQTDPGDNPVEP